MEVEKIRCCESFTTKLAMKEIIPHPKQGYMMYMTSRESINNGFPPLLSKIEYCPFCGTEHKEVFDPSIVELFG